MSTNAWRDAASSVTQRGVARRTKAALSSCPEDQARPGQRSRTPRPSGWRRPRRARPGARSDPQAGAACAAAAAGASTPRSSPAHPSVAEPRTSAARSLKGRIPSRVRSRYHPSSPFSRNRIRSSRVRRSDSSKPGRAAGLPLPGARSRDRLRRKTLRVCAPIIVCARSRAAAPQ